MCPKVEGSGRLRLEGGSICRYLPRFNRSRRFRCCHNGPLYALSARPIETRLIERLEDGTWRYGTYVWDEAGTDAVLAPMEGIPALPVGASGTVYTIPSEYDCRACHEGGRVPVLGFSALQLFRRSGSGRRARGTRTAGAGRAAGSR